MIGNFRRFEVQNPWGKTWVVTFQWLQTAISIRHSDTVDVKFALSAGETRMERVIALSHPGLLALSKKTNRPLTDSWCMKLAALHLKRMIETDEDIEKPLVTVRDEELEEYGRQVAKWSGDQVAKGSGT
jgi:hypothetical protein